MSPKLRKRRTGEDQSEFINPKFTLDVSFLLATVIAGAAVVEAIKGYCENSKTLTMAWPLACQTATVILTTLRFFNGNVMWNYVNFRSSGLDRDLLRGQRVFQRLSSYYLHIVQYLLFYMAARCVGDPANVLKMMLVISGIDILWTLGGWQHAGNAILRRALLSWWVLNILSFSLCLIYLVVLMSFRVVAPATSYYVFGVFAMAAAGDYLWNVELYFGYVEEGQLAFREESHNGKQD